MEDVRDSYLNWKRQLDISNSMVCLSDPTHSKPALPDLTNDGKKSVKELYIFLLSDPTYSKLALPDLTNDGKKWVHLLCVQLKMERISFPFLILTSSTCMECQYIGGCAIANAGIKTL